MFDKSFTKSVGENVESNIERFIAEYPNYNSTDYFVDYPVYFIDCYEWYCPAGCNVECPGSDEGFLPLVLPKQDPGGLRPPMSLPKEGECPKKEKRVYMRVHIGKLTEDEVKYIGDSSLSRKLIDFRLATDVSLETPEEILDHHFLLERYKAEKAADRQGLSSRKKHIITVVVSLVKLAVNLRTTRKRAWGYSLVVGNIPGIPVEQSSPATPSIVPEKSPEPGTSVEKQTNRSNLRGKKTVDEKLQRLIYRDPLLAEQSAKELAFRLKCSKAAIIAAPTWDKIMSARAKAKTVSYENPDQIPDTSWSKEDFIDEVDQRLATDRS
jgi:hypothetical protein